MLTEIRTLAFVASVLAQDPLPLLEPGKPVAGTVGAGAEEVVLVGQEDIACAGDPWRFEVERAGFYTIELRSDVFNALLHLEDAAGTVLADNDNGPIGKHARLVIELEAEQTYHVLACALHGVEGPYELSLTEGEPVDPPAAELRKLVLADAKRRVAVVEELRPGSFELAWAIEHLAHVHFQQGRPGEARPYFERALALLEEVRGPNDTSTAECAGNFGILLWSQGEYALARELAERALEVFNEKLPADHPMRASALTNVAVILKAMGEYERAMVLYQEAVQIMEQSPVGEDGTADVLNNLGRLQHAVGDFSGARASFERAIVIMESLYGPYHDSVAVSVGNLGVMLDSSGRYAEARLHLERALDIFESLHGPRHPRVALSLTNLATLLARQGERESAVPPLERALEIFETSVGPNHPHTITALSNLAGAYRGSAKYDRALALYERALATRERVFGPEHPDTALALVNYAWVLVHSGRHDEGRRAFERALELRRTHLGPEHLLTANSQVALGKCLARVGENEEARRLLEAGVATRRRLLGSSSRDAADALEILGLVELQAGQVETARAHLIEAFSIARRHLGDALLGLAEAERFGAVWSMRGNLDAVLAIADWEGGEDAAAALAWKGQLLGLLVTGREAEAALGAEAQLLRDRLVFVRSKISDVAFSGRVDTEELSRLRDEAAQLELRLAAAWREAGVRAEAPSLQQVQAALPPESALIDFIEHQPWRPVELEGGAVVQQAGWATVRLAAFVYRADRELPQRVDLGPAREIREATGEYLQALLVADGAERGVAPREAEPRVDFETAAAQLRERLWAPLAPALGTAETIFLSPDGDLGALPFGALLDADGRYLVESKRFVVLEAPAALARLGRADLPAGDRVLAAGGMDYGDLEGGAGWVALAGTSRELDTIAALRASSTAPFERLDAGRPTESALKKAMPGARWIHLATHGFFEPGDASRSTRAALDAAAASEEGVNAVPALPPGLLSGLVCASANDAGGGSDAGRLTGSEIAFLDLSACELAVLSACNSGVGDARIGEGMLSVQRAFHAAGARAVVAALWRVEDAATANLIERFYENLWTEGLGKLDALRAAQLSILAERRAAGDARGAPYAWAGFTLSGDWE